MVNETHLLTSWSFLKRFYLFIFREGEGKEKERERNINVWLLLAQPLLGTWPATQACALTGNQTGDPLVRRLVLNPLSHTHQDYLLYFNSSHPNRCEMVSHCGFDLHFHDQYVEHHFHILAGHLFISEKCLFKFYAHFVIGYLFVCYWVIEVPYIF